MTINQIRKFHQAVPFRPFYLHLSSGKKVRVTNPENLGYSARSTTVSVFEDPDAADLINLSDVVKVEGSRSTAAATARRSSGTLWRMP